MIVSSGLSQPLEAAGKHTHTSWTEGSGVGRSDTGSSAACVMQSGHPR